MLNNLLYVTGILMTGFTLNYHIFWTLRAMNFISNLQEEGKEKTYQILCLRCTLFHILTFLKWGWAFTTNVSGPLQPMLSQNLIISLLPFLMVYNEWEIVSP